MLWPYLPTILHSVCAVPSWFILEVKWKDLEEGIHTPQNREPVFKSSLTSGLFLSSGGAVAKEAVRGSAGNSDHPRYIQSQSFKQLNKDFKLKINED